MITSNAILVEPILAQILALILNIDLMPGLLTFIGVGVAIAGLFFLGVAKKQEE